ncbi:MAG: leucine--tRNA ligase [Firmicutes bacterium]|nr:leucine--tRNA ligase [Bacillota bacterium]
MKVYNHITLEKKWQKIWDDEKAFHVEIDHSKPKFYALIEFPYPSGQGLHVGHPRPYTAMDIIARKRRMQGYNVLFPMGWDAFGLPTENYAIKNKIHPAEVTKNNVARFKSQLKMLGFSFDWDREVNTTDPAYYRWTQWIFLQLFKKGLAYKKEIAVNWCPSCKVGLANEEVVDGCCERCGTPVEHRMKTQWMLKITEYAQKLIDGLTDLDFIERVKTQQINWIGRSEGAEVDFKAADRTLTVYTTRPDTLFGATYMVMSPEHPYIDEWKNQIENIDEIEAYRAYARSKSDFERTELAKEKTGVEIKGIRAVNPVNGKEIPIWISDYVLMSYGTGAIMAVPAHDTRDYDFAKKFSLPIIEVVAGGDIEKEAFTDIETGTMVNSGFLNGLSVAEAKKAIIEWLSDQGIGHRKVNYKLRDWVFSRQRYWGEPIPVVYCEHCGGYVALPEDQLPLLLPKVESYEPGPNGESPLASMTEWVNTTCPVCGHPAKRETDTMPQWAGSSWYFLRYMDPHNDQALASKEALEYWSPVDWYNGGMEHTTLHLLYSRFWHKFLYDQGIVPTPEPYQKRTSHGMILGEDGQKMSKSRGNVVNPDEVVADYGADTMRLYEMFIGDFASTAPWSTTGVKGCRRFVERVWKLQDMITDDEGISKDLECQVHRTIKKVTLDYEAMKFNTGIAALMALLNDFYAKGSITRGEMRIFLQLINPAAPHFTEEMWEMLGFEGRIYQSVWPSYDEAKTISDTVEIAVQIMGKPRAIIQISRTASKEEALAVAKEEPRIRQLLEGKTIVKEIYVPGRIVNIVAK